MEVFRGLCDEVLRRLIRAGTLKIYGADVKNYHELDGRARLARDAEIDSLLGDDSVQQLLAIEDLLSKGFAQQLEDIRLIVLEAMLQEKYDRLKKGLNDVQLIYKEYTDSLAGASRNGCLDEAAAWNRFEACFPLGDIDWLYKWIAEEGTVPLPNLMKGLVKVCNLNQFKGWQQDICRTFAQAYFLQAAYFYHSVFRRSHTPQADLPDGVQKKLEVMLSRAQHVTELMNDTYRRVKAGFLFRPCDDPQHKDCGGEAQDCFELTAKIYPELKNKDYLTNDTLASKIKENLQTTYPYFRWSVVVMKDPQYAEFQLNPVGHGDIWLQRFGTKQVLPFQAPVRDNLVMSRGLGAYGCLLCYRVEPTSEKAVLVFWADKEVFRSVEQVTKCETVMRTWHDTRPLVDLSKSGNVYWFSDWFQKMDVNYAFGVGIRVKPNEAMGICLSDENGSSFPLFFGKGSVCVLMWPVVTGIRNTLVCDVIEEKVQKLENHDSIFKGHLRNDNDQILAGQNPGNSSTCVIIKTTPLSVVSVDQRQEQIALLDKYFTKFGVMKQFRHPSVVRFFGCQPFISVDKPVYRMVMEYCAGGSLTEKVRQDVTLCEIYNWTLAIVKGLAYLHGIRSSHKDLKGDHLMFQGPLIGEGNLKIISIGRIQEITSSAERTVQNQAKGPFQPPEFSSLMGKRGSRTDIYSLGCVIIQMITGQIPVPVKENNDRPLIPDGVPADLKTLIEDCIHVSYGDRKSAAALFDTLVVTKDAYVNAAWTCPSRASLE